MIKSTILRGTAWRSLVCAIAVGGAFALSACNFDDKKVTDAQIVARLDDQDITTTELDHEMDALKIPAEKRGDKEPIRAVLTEIVARKYLTQEAVAGHIDREPAVYLDINRSRETLLASVFVRRDISRKSASLSNEEVEAYIHAHPELYISREVYGIEQVAFVPPPNVDQITKEMSGMKSLDDVESELKKRNIKDMRSTGTLDTANLTPNVVSLIRARKDSNVFFIRAGSLATFFSITERHVVAFPPEVAFKRAKDELIKEIMEHDRKETYDDAVKKTKFFGSYASIMGETSKGADSNESPKVIGGSPVSSDAGSAEGEKPALDTLASDPSAPAKP